MIVLFPVTLILDAFCRFRFPPFDSIYTTDPSLPTSIFPHFIPDHGEVLFTLVRVLFIFPREIFLVASVTAFRALFRIVPLLIPENILVLASNCHVVSAFTELDATGHITFTHACVPRGLVTTHQYPSRPMASVLYTILFPSST